MSNYLLRGKDEKQSKETKGENFIRTKCLSQTIWKKIILKYRKLLIKWKIPSLPFYSSRKNKEKQKKISINIISRVNLFLRIISTEFNKALII